MVQRIESTTRCTLYSMDLLVWPTDDLQKCATAGGGTTATTAAAAATTAATSTIATAATCADVWVAAGTVYLDVLVWCIKLGTHGMQHNSHAHVGDLATNPDASSGLDGVYVSTAQGTAAPQSRVGLVQPLYVLKGHEGCIHRCACIVHACSGMCHAVYTADVCGLRVCTPTAPLPHHPHSCTHV